MVEEAIPSWLKHGTVFVDANGFLCVVIGAGILPKRKSLVSNLQDGRKLELSFLEETHDCVWIARKNENEQLEIVSFEEIDSLDECSILFEHELE